MKKRAVVILQYQTEEELNTFLSKNGTYLQVDGIYEDLSASDTEEIEEHINNVTHKDEQ